MPQKPQRRFWSTLDEYERNAEVDRLKQEEFFSKPETVLAGDSDAPENSSRRDFLKLTGAAAVLSMVSCAQRPVERIIPYVDAPADVIPGVANYYASSSDESGAGILVKTREGRPINILPNDLDPLSGYGLNSRAIAAIYDLYDPDRARHPMKIDNGMATKVSWDDAYKAIADAMKTATGEVVLLTGSMNGITRERMIQQLKTDFPKFRHVMADATSDDMLTMANQKSYGTANLPHYHFDRAKTMVSLGGDALADGRTLTKNAQTIASTRKVVETGSMSRMIAFEPTLTETGLNVDYRYKVRNEDMVFVALAIAHELAETHGKSDETAVKRWLQSYTSTSIEEKLHLKAGTIKFVAAELAKHAGESVVYSEGNANRTKNGEALHVVTNLINSMLGNVGKTIDYTTNYDKRHRGSAAALEQLVADMNAGRVSAVMIAGTNPVYFHANGDAFAAALKKVGVTVSFSQRLDETAAMCQYLLPGTHALESWGDREFTNGFHTIVQPAINPIWDNRQFEESLIQIAKRAGGAAFASATTMYDYVRDSWKLLHSAQGIAASFEQFWVKVVRDGVYDTLKDRSTSTALNFNTSALNQISINHTSEDLTLSVFVSSTMGDGSQGNNPYLKEAPDPVSKVTWDNFLALAPETAKKLGLWFGDLAEVKTDNASLTIPVNILPGMHPDVATIAAGWGHSHGGQIAKAYGVNAFKFTANGMFSGHTVSISKAGSGYKLADVQGHHYLDDGFRFVELHDHHKKNFREIIFETSLKEFKEHPEKVVKYHTEELTDQVKSNKIDNLWNVSTEDVHKYPGHRWGMVVDLNSCIGCNACTIACQVENNVPVVGKKEVLLGREMHWIRIDRYFVGDQETPDTVVQPMMCQHCDNAPCETVCPVVATTHNQEGLNVMTYNRCVGTRYCANNCPYKVRRFNFHEYTKGDATKGAGMIEALADLGLGSEDGLNKMGYDLSEYPMQMMLNPDVTVREKGVMEKCTYCVQKIREAKYEAKMKGVSVNDLDNVTTACETACPANAIAFGDMNNPNSKVAKLKESQINFGSLAELNTKPSTSYISVVRNVDEPYWAGGDHGDDHGKTEEAH